MFFYHDCHLTKIGLLYKKSLHRSAISLNDLLLPGNVREKQIRD